MPHCASLRQAGRPDSQNRGKRNFGQPVFRGISGSFSEPRGVKVCSVFLWFFGEAFCEALGDLGSQSAPKRRSLGVISASFWQVGGNTKTMLPLGREHHVEAGGGPGGALVRHSWEDIFHHPSWDDFLEEKWRLSHGGAI